MSMGKSETDKHGLQGLSFGLMDGIITIVGIIIGLGATGSKTVIMLGVVVAGIADAFANAAGFHVSEETEGFHSRREVLLSTFFAFLGTVIVTIVLIIPFVFLDMISSIYSSVTIGIILLVLLGIFVGKVRKLKKRDLVKLTVEYIVIGIAVIIVSYLIGNFWMGLI